MRDRHWFVRLRSAVFRNAIGAVLVMLGVAMSLPGVRGQGLLTILVGLMLVDFPGKRTLQPPARALQRSHLILAGD